MEFKEIQFTGDDAQRVYRIYIQSVKKATQQLRREDSLEILMEFNSHLYEGSRAESSKSELSNLLDTINDLGVPQEVLKPMIAEKMVDKAARSFKPIDIYNALYLNIGNGISYIIFAILYCLVCLILFVTVLKLIYSDFTGLFIGDDLFLLGTNFGNATYMGFFLEGPDGDFSGATEVLGNWFIPLMVLLNTVLYFIITIALSFKKNINIKYRKP